MYIRTHTHTQARTHTTKFSGQHVVHFFTLSLFFFFFFLVCALRGFDEMKLLGASILYSTGCTGKTNTNIAHNRDVAAPMHAHTERFSVT